MDTWKDQVLKAKKNLQVVLDSAADKDVHPFIQTSVLNKAEVALAEFDKVANEVALVAENGVGEFKALHDKVTSSKATALGLGKTIKLHVQAAKEHCA